MSNRENLKRLDSFDSRADFSKRQKRMAVAFILFAAILVVFGVIKIIDQIRSPFDLSVEPSQEAITELDQALLDSDGDGLSDYDELYTYQTSPYLEDSDSDGLSDFEEVNQGNNPNCPVGENCLTSEIISSDENSLSGLNYLEETVSEEAEENVEVNLNDMTPDLLRGILLESGYEATVLEQISDEDLMASYFEALESKSDEETPLNNDTQIENLGE